MLPRWMAAWPACSSARESLSLQILSPMVTGRFLAAAPQSPEPPGCTDTLPSTELMRATRVGGSLSSALAFCTPRRRRPLKQSSKLRLLFMLDVVFMVVPCPRPGRSQSADGSISLDELPSSRTRGWERSCPRCGLQGGSQRSDDSRSTCLALNLADSIAYETRADAVAEGGRWLVGAPFPPIW